MSFRFFLAPFMKKRRSLRRWFVLVFLGFGVLLPGAWLALHLVSLPRALFEAAAGELEFLDRTGQPLRIVRLDDGPFRHAVQYSEIPPLLIHATLAAEDQRFWQHPGVDWRATLRAAGQLVLHRRVISGGSTITQQLIKLAQPRRRTLRTKLVEAMQAIRLEEIWTKQQILAAYLNHVDYGNFNRGCATAAQFYFAKPLRDLSTAECALLAALPQAPSRLNPLTHLDRAVKRQQWILTRMRQSDFLTDEQFLRAKVEPVHLTSARRVFEAPHFLDLLLAQWTSYNLSNLNTSTRSRNSLAIRTTLFLPLTQYAETTLRCQLSRLRLDHVANGSIVVMDNQTGDVLTLVGSENYFDPGAGQVNGAWAPRSPGSALKPFTYLLALEHGATPATIVADVPTEFSTATGLFSPVNYNHCCYGPMRYRLALANSLNISAVKVLASLGGPEPLQRLLQNCGLSTLTRPPEAYGLGLTIGNAEVRLLELANAYAALARLGQFKPYRLLLDSPRQVLDCSSLLALSKTASGSPHFSTREAPRPGVTVRVQTAQPAAAYLIADILSDNEARNLAFGSESPLRFDFPVACKTGTSSDFRDNWAFGYTPEFTVGVWVGNFDGSPMRHVSGVTGAAPVLHEIMQHLHQLYGTSWYSVPTNVVECWVHPITGKRLGVLITGALKEKFTASNLPALETPSDYLKISDSGSIVLLGSEYRDWLASSDNCLGDRAALAPIKESLRVLSPLPGTIIYLDADLPRLGRCLPLRAAGPENPQWHSDSLQIARQAGRELALLTEGRHQITVCDPASGAQAQTWIEVLSR
jgi:penicillin-binding protein 1C